MKTLDGKEAKRGDKVWTFYQSIDENDNDIFTPTEVIMGYPIPWAPRFTANGKCCYSSKVVAEQAVSKDLYFCGKWGQ